MIKRRSDLRSGGHGDNTLKPFNAGMQPYVNPLTYNNELHTW